MAALARYGIRPIFIVAYGNPLYSGDKNERVAPANDESRKAFAAWAKAFAARYKGKGIIWEIWNEPNYGFWLPGSNPKDYTLLVKEASKAIREADPEAMIIGPATAYIDPGFIDQACQNGLLNYVDAISVHPYRGSNMPPETAEPDYKPAREVIDRYAPKGTQIPMFSGEWGYSQLDMNAEQQAQFITRMFLTNLMCGMRLSIWYDWHDDGENPKEREHHFGTVNWDFTPKPAYNAVQTLTKELKGYHFVRRLYSKDPSDYVLLFGNGKTYKLAAWTPGNEHETDLPLDVKGVILTDMYGKRRAGNLANGLLKIKLSQYVTYISFPGSSKRLALEEAWQVEAEKQAGALSPQVSWNLSNPYKTNLNSKTVIRDLEGRELDSMQASTAPKGETSRTASPVLPWDGISELGAVVELYADGLDRPLQRKVSFDSSHRFSVSSSISAGEALLNFSNPSGEPFEGKAKLSRKGKSEGSWQAIKLNKDQKSAQVRYPVDTTSGKDQPLELTVLNSRGVEVYKADVPSYKAVKSIESADTIATGFEGDPAVKGGIRISNAVPPKELPGIDNCIKLDYTFGEGWRYGRLFSKMTEPILGTPKEIGVWIYGDKSGNAIRARILDSAGQYLQPTLADIDWEGWKFVTCRLDQPIDGHWGGPNDGNIHWPISWNTLLLLDSNKKEQSGTIYVGPMRLVY
jgi:hypothetical protein